MKCRLIIRLFLWLSLFLFPGALLAQGLRLRGLESTIGERSSLSLFPHQKPLFRDSLALRFEARLESDRFGLGYLCRVELDPGSGAPVINLLVERVSDTWVIRVIWEGQRFLASLPVPSSDLTTGRWFSMSLLFDLERDSVTLSVADRWSVSGQLDLPPRIRPDIVFGRSGDLTDVLPLSLRNISVAGSRRPCFFPLDEAEGRFAHCVNRLFPAEVTNPYWLRADASRWKPFFTRFSPIYQCVGYDPVRHRLWSFSRDSLSWVSLSGQGRTDDRFASPCPVPISLGTSFMDPRSGCLYVYDMFQSGEQIARQTPSLARLSPGSLSWEPVSTDAFTVQFHHHNEFVDPDSSRLVVFGGYGFRKYNGDFYSLPFVPRGEEPIRWEKLPAVNGDPLWPRFLGSMGYNPADGKLYVFGGKGNESGEQIVGAQYLYSLHSIDLKTMECRKLWQIPWSGDNIVTGREMVIDDTGHFYVLGYSEAYTQTHLLLYRFSLLDGSFEVLADPIPFYSDRISCLANLHFDPVLSKLVAVVEESKDDVRSRVSAYVLDYPPQPSLSIPGYAEWLRRFPLLAWLSLFLFLACVFLGVRYLRIRRRRIDLPLLTPERETRPDSILLFGGITMRDREGKDITSQFTGKIRQMFCILLRRGSQGMSSKHMSSVLWPDRAESETKNVRGVTVNKLRKLLSKMDGIQLVSREKRFFLETEKPLFCDYVRFNELLSERHPDMDQVIRILSRGPFLMEETDPVYDKMKETVEGQIDRVMSAELPRRYSLRQFSVCLICANILFDLDPLNEEALSYSIRSLLAMEKEEDAKALYTRFITRYKKDYGEEYAKSYESISSPLQD